MFPETPTEYIFRILPSHTGAQFTAANCISLDRVKRLSVEFITSVYAQGAKDACGGIYVVESIHYIDNAKDKIFVLSDLDLHNYFKVYMSGGKLFVKSISRTNDDSEELAATTKSTQTATNTEVALESAKPPEAVKVKQPKADESATASPQQTNLVRAIVDLVAIAAVSVEAAVTDATHKIAIQQQLKTVQKSAQDSLVVAARVAKRDSLLARHQAHQAHKSIRCAAKSCSEALAAFASNSAPTTTATAAGLKREEPNVVLKIAAASEQDPVDLPKPTTPKQAPQDISPVAQEGPPSPQPQAALEQKSDDEDKKEPLFIHGRHTCDQCLATPVIGKRFRAINLPDYDLCEKCHGAYQGDKIQFEEAKLGT